VIWLATASSGTDWGVLLGGIGIGAIVGSAVTGAFTALNGKWQRVHDREMRRLDHQHENELRAFERSRDIDLKRFEDKQRLRDRRLVILQDGLTEMVEGFVALTEAMGWMRYRGNRRDDADRARADAAKHFDLARPRLVLDPAGREVMETFRTIQTELIVWENTDDRLQWAKMDPEIVKMLSDAVNRAQQIMEQAAQPVTA
jgi:hypothetical protein